MKSTLKERLEQLEKLQRRLAIWEGIHSLVDEKFISKDGRKVSGIRIPGASNAIPENEIEDVLQQIGEGPIADLRAEILAIEESEVVVLGESKASA